MVSIHALLAECDRCGGFPPISGACFNPRTPCGVRPGTSGPFAPLCRFQSTHSLRSATDCHRRFRPRYRVSIHALLAECDSHADGPGLGGSRFNPRTPCGVRLMSNLEDNILTAFQSTHSLRSATSALFPSSACPQVSIHALLAECDVQMVRGLPLKMRFQSTHSLRSATAPDLIHCYSTEQIILCANLPKKTVIARLLFLSIYLSIFYSQCITPIADLPGNSCELEVGAQAMFNSL